MARETAEVIIIGGGIAGLATAWQLSRLGCKDILVLEREAIPGFYASGHNAGIARQLTGSSEHTALTIEGRKWLGQASLVDDSGGLMLGAEQGGTASLHQEALDFGLPVSMLGPACLQRTQCVKGLKVAEGLAIPSDGIIDTDGLLRFCMEGAREKGVQFRLGCEVLSIENAHGFDVQTAKGIFRAPILVNAAGAWATPIARMAQGVDIAFRPLRRHLIWSSEPYPQQGPWTWWADRQLYLRFESGGLLMCACEEEEMTPPARGIQPACDRAVLESLFDRLQELAPHLAERAVTRLWCGLRTFSPDRRFVLGEDPVRPGLFWAAGLGGHGMTSGLAVGRVVAEAILGHGSSDSALHPGRFMGAQSLR